METSLSREVVNIYREPNVLSSSRDNIFYNNDFFFVQHGCLTEHNTHQNTCNQG